MPLKCPPTRFAESQRLALVARNSVRLRGDELLHRDRQRHPTVRLVRLNPDAALRLVSLPKLVDRGGLGDVNRRGLVVADGAVLREQPSDAAGYRTIDHLGLTLERATTAAALRRVLEDCERWEAEEDPAGRLLPRSKRHDDKTLVVARQFNLGR